MKIKNFLCGDFYFNIQERIPLKSNKIDFEIEHKEIAFDGYLIFSKTEFNPFVTEIDSLDYIVFAESHKTMENIWFVRINIL